MGNSITPHVLIRRSVFSLLLSCLFVNSRVNFDSLTVIAKTTTMIWSSIDKPTTALVTGYNLLQFCIKVLSHQMLLRMDNSSFIIPPVNIFGTAELSILNLANSFAVNIPQYHTLALFHPRFNP